MTTWDYITRTILDDSVEVSEETVSHFRKHPEDLEQISDKASFNFFFFILIFLAGIIITLIARLLQYYWSDGLNRFVKDILLDIVSEIGVAVFGGAIVAYFIEFHRSRQYQRNLKVRNKIRAILEKDSK